MCVRRTFVHVVTENDTDGIKTSIENVVVWWLLGSCLVACRVYLQPSLVYLWVLRQGGQGVSQGTQ